MMAFFTQPPYKEYKLITFFDVDDYIIYYSKNKLFTREVYGRNTCFDYFISCIH